LKCTFLRARPAQRVAIARFPSWHAYSKIRSSGSAVRTIENVHGAVHVLGSSTVTLHSSFPSGFGVNRSTKRSRSALAPWPDSLVTEVRRLDNQRIALKAAPPVAIVRANANVDMRAAVERDPREPRPSSRTVSRRNQELGRFRRSYPTFRESSNQADAA
jgi:hypothetical protein